MLIKQKLTFSISNNSLIPIEIKKAIKISSITYYTDAVYKPITYDIQFKLSHNQQQQQNPVIQKATKIQMEFGFLLQQIKIHKRILDNIGVIVIKNDQQSVRYGILITQQNGVLYASFIQ